MKRSMCYVVSIVLLSVIFGFCYYSSYKNSLKEISKNKKNQTDTEIVYDTPISTAETVESSTVEVVSSSKNRILPTTVYYEEIVRLPERFINTKSGTTPGYLIGLTKEELTDYIDRYMENMTISEFEEGLVSYELVLFSDEKIVVRKTYDTEKVSYKYYVNISDGMVTVYYSDLKTVFEYTHIPAVDLPEDIRLNLLSGLYIKDKEELYALLEGFSS